MERASIIETLQQMINIKREADITRNKIYLASTKETAVHEGFALILEKRKYSDLQKQVLKRCEEFAVGRENCITENIIKQALINGNKYTSKDKSFTNDYEFAKEYYFKIKGDERLDGKDKLDIDDIEKELNEAIMTAQKKYEEYYQLSQLSEIQNEIRNADRKLRKKEKEVREIESKSIKDFDEPLSTTDLLGMLLGSILSASATLLFPYIIYCIALFKKGYIIDKNGNYAHNMSKLLFVYPIIAVIILSIIFIIAIIIDYQKLATKYHKEKDIENQLFREYCNCQKKEDFFYDKFLKKYKDLYEEKEKMILDLISGKDERSTIKRCGVDDLYDLMIEFPNKTLNQCASIYYHRTHEEIRELMWEVLGEQDDYSYDVDEREPSWIEKLDNAIYQSLDNELIDDPLHGKLFVNETDETLEDVYGNKVYDLDEISSSHVKDTNGHIHLRNKYKY